MPKPKITPVGTLAELEEKNLDPVAYGSCAKPVKDGSVLEVRGCPHWKICKFPFKGKSGPQNVKVSAFKRNGAMRQLPMACYDWYQGPHVSNLAPDNGNVFKIIGKEGDEYFAMETEPEKRVEDGKVIITHKDRIVKRTVPKHPHTFDSPDLVSEATTHAVRKEMMEEHLERKLSERGKIEFESTSDGMAEVFNGASEEVEAEEAGGEDPGHAESRRRRGRPPAGQRKEVHEE